MAKHRTWSPPGPYRVGDWVKIPLWRPPIVGQVVEDRGLIGQLRQHYYTIRFLGGDPDDPWIVGYPAEKMAPAAPEEVEAELKKAEETRRLSI